VISNFGKDLPHFQFAVFAAQTKVLDSRLEDFTAFTKALLEGTRIVANDEALAIAEFSRFAKDMSPEQMHEVYVGLHSIGMFGVNGGIGKENFDYTVKVLRDANILRKNLTYEEAFDTRPRDAALKAIGTATDGN
jgi:nitrate reductase assembly molybdenum cofactor insertion protein NarJ